MSFRQFCVIVLTTVFLTGCSTTMEVTARQWENCQKLCGGKLARAGTDYFSSEKTCLCENSVRFRYEGQKQSSDDDE